MKDVLLRISEKFTVWLNASLVNRAVFSYTIATLNIVVRQFLYFWSTNTWIIDSFFYKSVIFSYVSATFALLVFGVIKNCDLSKYSKKIFDIEKFRENKRRRELFAKIVADKYNAHGAKRYYSESIAPNIIFVMCLSTITQHTPPGVFISICSVLYIFWILGNLFYFDRCMAATPVPDELKTLMPNWVIRLQEYNKNLQLITGTTNSAAESAVNSSWPKRAATNAVKRITQATSDSASYLLDTRNLPQIIKTSVGALGVLVGIDYAFSECNSRTSIVTRFLEYNLKGQYSIDPDARIMANKLRDRGVDISDCCVEGTNSLDPMLVETRYEAVISTKSPHSEDTLNSYMHAQKVFLEEKYNLEKELALKEKELALKEKELVFEKELALKEKELVFEKELALKEKELAFEKGKNLALEQIIDKNRGSMESSII